jgi:hypothetical protein
MTTWNEVLPPGWKTEGDVLRVLDAMRIPDPDATRAPLWSGRTLSPFSTYADPVRWDVRFDRRPPQTVRVASMTGRVPTAAPVVTREVKDARFEVHAWTRGEPSTDPDGLLVLRVGDLAIVIAQLRHPAVQDEGWAIVAHLRAWLTAPLTGDFDPQAPAPRKEP